MSTKTTGKRLRLLLAFVVGLVLLLPSGVAFGQQPPGPVVRFQFRTAGLPQPAAFHIVHNRTHFAPGAATPFHKHPGQVVVTVLEGELTFNAQGVDKVYKAGESFVEPVNEKVQARNTSAAPVSAMVTYLIPREMPLLVPEPGDTTLPPRPFFSYQFKTDVAPMPDPFDVVKLIQDFDPGAATPFHTHPGIVVVTMLSGELTLNRQGVDHIYKEGESFVEVPNEVYQARNPRSTTARVMASFLIPAGAPLSHPQPGPAAPAALPKTGEAGSCSLADWLLLIATFGLLAGVWLIYRRHRQRG